MSYTKEDILRMAKEDDVEFIRMQFTDIFGQLKNVAITRSQLAKALDNRIIFDGSLIEGFARTDESDRYLRPDLDTWNVLPWRPQRGKVARLICDVYNMDGTPFEGDPRYILKRQLERAEKLGYVFHVGPECEFFLFETDESGNVTTRTSDEAGYFDLAPLDHGSDTRREICLTLEKMGYEVEASHHEMAHGQHEIDFRYARALSAADNIMTFKLAVKVIAQKNGLHATFMPKPLYGVAGSGMQINMSLFRDGKNCFYDPAAEKGLSLTARQFIAGILKHIRAITAITNPLVNSYKRLVPGYEAPCYPSWSTVSRSALIRVPAADETGTRIELRSPDPSCNPYLAMAVCLAAGLDGIEHGMTPPDEIRENISAMSEAARRDHNLEALPASLADALQALKEDPLIENALGSHACSQFINSKNREYLEYSGQVTRWELDRYMNSY